MTDDEIRKRVRERVSNQTLPRQLHLLAQPLRPGEPVPTGMVAGSALSGACAVCDEGATQMRFNVSPGPIAFHSRCYEIWKEEGEKARPRD